MELLLLTGTSVPFLVSALCAQPLPRQGVSMCNRVQNILAECVGWISFCSVSWKVSFRSAVQWPSKAPVLCGLSHFFPRERLSQRGPEAGKSSELGTAQGREPL